MVRIRLRRVGGKNQPSFRIVAADKESPRDGRFIEILGFYNPRTEPATIQLKEDRIYEWIGNGAQPSDSAMQIFQTAGLMDRYERFKQGEAVEKLLAEAEEAEKARTVSPQTRHEPPVGKPNRKAEEAAVAQAEAEASTGEEAGDEEAEAPAEETPTEAEEPATEEEATEESEKEAEEEAAEEPDEEAEAEKESVEEAEEEAAGEEGEDEEDDEDEEPAEEDKEE